MTAPRIERPCEPITVILPLKNYHEPFLRAALDSILQQTSDLWRLSIVVESRDRAFFTDHLATNLADERVTLMANDGRKLAGAINTAMFQADTSFVAILLGDDCWSTDAIEVLQRYIAANPRTDFFHSARAIIDAEDQLISPVFPARESFRLADFKGSSPVKHLLCWRRELALPFGGLDESLNSVGPDDWDFPWCMAEHGARFTAIQECLYYYRDHRESYRLTTHLPLSHHRREIDRILRKHGVPRAERRQGLADRERRYLRQCLYRSRMDRLWKTLRGFDPRRGWRETYR